MIGLKINLGWLIMVDEISQLVGCLKLLIIQEFGAANAKGKNLGAWDSGWNGRTGFEIMSVGPTSRGRHVSSLLWRISVPLPPTAPPSSRRVPPLFNSQPIFLIQFSFGF